MFCKKCGKQIQENVRFCANCGQMARVIILGDDVELAHYEITKKTEPIMVDVNLTGVSWLRVELQFNTEDGAGDFYVLLSDFELHK